MRKYGTQTTGPQRLLLGAIGGLITACLPLPFRLPTKMLLAWCIGISVYLALALILAVHCNGTRTKERAQAQDQPSIVLLISMVITVFTSIVTIGFMLSDAKHFSGIERTIYLVLSMIALSWSWVFIQVVFAFHYAHRYYHEQMKRSDGSGGLQFPGDREPDYFDFFYYAFVVGMTAQVSDVTITSYHLRRLTLAHSIASFAFNILILAMSVNVIAGAA